MKHKITKKPEQIKEVSKVSSKNAAGSTTEAGTATAKRRGRKPGSTTPKELSSEEKAILKASEKVIEQHLLGGWELAKALTEISEKRLYRGSGTFKKYCLLRWRLSYRRVQQLITALAVRQHIASECETSQLPETECQVRPLTLLKDKDLQVKAWNQAYEAASGQPTGIQVKEAVLALAPKTPPSREAKVAGLLRDLKARSTVAAEVNPKVADLLDKAMKLLSEEQASKEEKPSRGRKAKS